MSSENDHYLSPDEQFAELAKARPVKLQGLLCRGIIEVRDGALVCRCPKNLDEGTDKEFYDPFELYQPQYYQARDRPLVKKALGEGTIRWPLVEFVNRRDPLDFCKDYGLPVVDYVVDVVEENNRCDCCLPLEQYDFEKRLFTVFVKLSNALKHPERSNLKGLINQNERTIREFFAQAKNSDPHKAKVEFMQKFLAGELLEVPSLVFVINLLSSIFDLKTPHVGPKFMSQGKFGWKFGNLLTCLYLMHWLDGEQGRYLVDCGWCGEWFYPDKRKAFCSPECRNRHHATESRNLHKRITRQYQAKHGGMRQEAEKWLAGQRAKGKSLREIEVKLLRLQ